jgi:hypothetical protein
MKIRPEMMDAFAKDSLVRFRERMKGELSAKFPEETAGRTPEQLDGLCQRAVDKAGGYNIRFERNILVVAATMLLFGEDFDDAKRPHPSRDLLINPQIDEDVKARALELRIAIDAGKQV